MGLWFIKGVYWLVGMLLLTGLSNTQSGVFFIKRDSVHTVYSSWLLTLTVDMQPYRAQLGELGEELRKFEQAIHFVRYRGDNIGGKTGQRAYHKEVQYELESELSKFRERYYNLWDVYNEVLVVINTQGASKTKERNKRAVLPGVGSVLSFLFGTATEANLDQIKRMVIKLGSSQGQVIHVVEKSITLLNKTNTAVEENRHVLNLLRNATVKFQFHLAALTRQLYYSG